MVGRVMSHSLAYAVAKAIINGFERHIFLFQQTSQLAKDRFERSAWQEVQVAAKERTDFYDKRVKETLQSLRADFNINSLDEILWQQAKQIYVELLSEHAQAELAESFYNSVFCHLFSRKYYSNKYIFVEAYPDRKQLLSNVNIFTRYEPTEHGLEHTVKTILQRPNFRVNYANIDVDVQHIINAFRLRAKATRFPLEQLQFDILDSIFYRNKGAYIIGKVNSPAGETPFIVALVNSKKGLYVDALLTDSEQMAVVFGFARAYFFVDCTYPAALVNFLNQLIPLKSKAELYSAIGFHKQGKTQFYRDFLHHLDASNDKLVLADGIKGMVMTVFTLPSYPYVFKIIKDKFSPSKQMTRAVVKEKYRLVKRHDRVGRMADTMEYSQVAFPRNRFSEELITELEKVAMNSIRYENDMVVIKHLYIERRMIPLNIYLNQATDEQIDSAIYGYGKAIKQLIAANIFPGDMLLKNFGVTRHGRVIFYDYDEITYMDEVNFRVKPEPQTEEQLYAAEPWYTVDVGDVFPEEIATFALANPKYKTAFIKHHPELLDAAYWQQCQQNIKLGLIESVYPYPNQYRFKQDNVDA